MTARGYRNVEPSQLSGLSGVRCIDVREPDEFTGPLGHLPGAELVPLGTLREAAQGWPREQPLLLVCRSGKRSAQAAEILSSLGFRRLYNLEGGMMAVNAAKLPVETGHGQP